MMTRTSLVKTMEGPLGAMATREMRRRRGGGMKDTGSRHGRLREQIHLKTSVGLFQF